MLEDADPWREDCRDMIRRRPDLHFLFLTKRIHRFAQCISSDWGQGYDYVTVGCTVENQKCADERLSLFTRLPIKHRNIICQPLIGPVDPERYLGTLHPGTVYPVWRSLCVPPVRQPFYQGREDLHASCEGAVQSGEESRYKLVKAHPCLQKGMLSLRRKKLEDKNED